MVFLDVLFDRGDELVVGLALHVGAAGTVDYLGHMTSPIVIRSDPDLRGAQSPAEIGALSDRHSARTARDVSSDSFG